MKEFFFSPPPRPHPPSHRRKHHHVAFSSITVHYPLHSHHAAEPRPSLPKGTTLHVWPMACFSTKRFDRRDASGLLTGYGLFVYPCPSAHNTGLAQARLLVQLQALASA